MVCDRGVNDRVAKSAEVKRAGGVGLVMTNPTNNSLNADNHSVPTVHVQNTDRAAIHAYAATAGATIALLVGDQTGAAPTPLPVVAGFSSRGPDLTSGGDLVKPDIAAPGVDIVAAVAPGPHGGNNFEPISGTSMSSPHIAGLAALILGKRPDWSPAAVKSAMMTTATDTKTEAGARNTNPFDQGAGFVKPRRFLEPGLVYDADVVDWIGYLEGTGVDTGTGVPAIDPSDVNVPSIGIGSLAGTQTVTRRVTATKGGTYRATVKVPGIQATVTPSVLRLAQGPDGGVHGDVHAQDRGAGHLRHRLPHLGLRQHRRPQPDRDPAGRARGAGGGLGDRRVRHRVVLRHGGHDRFDRPVGRRPHRR